MHLLLSLLFLAAPTTRYSTRVDWSQHSSCSQSWAHDKAQSSLTLDLNRDGKASACRGSSMDSVGGGWRREAPTRTRYEQQQGYRGEWSQRGEVLTITLTASDAICPTVPKVDASKPRSLRPHTLKLQCEPAKRLPKLVNAHDGMLACREISKGYVHGLLGLQVHGFAEKPVIIVSKGNGAVVSWHDEGFIQDVSRTVGTALTPLGIDSWRRPVPKTLMVVLPKGD